MTMTCHVLHAGDGYTYLTNQVASGDVERSAHEPLAGYYTAAGNPPGQWVGSGVADLGMSGQVSEEHMLALFGEGLHPDANRLIEQAIEAGMPYQKALAWVRLGRRFYQFAQPDVPLLGAVRAAYDEFERTHRRRPSVAERRAIKERVAGQLLTSADGVRPGREAVRKYLTDELGKARQPVAGFDLVFSPVKSVSVLWALGGHDVRQVVEEVHEAAWRKALAYGEREAGYTRVGKGGIAQIDTGGFVATAFVHRDSRCGDPDLHTHVVIANCVRGADGAWRTVDSKQMHRVAVSMSEVYNAALEQGLTERLGAAWTEVAKSGGKRGVREIAGVPQEWISGFSQRRTQVEAGYDQLLADYVARYGHTPPRSVQMKLAQQATLVDRPEKTTLRTLAEQVTDWAAAAREMLPGRDIDTVIAGALGRATGDGEPVDVSELAARVVEVVSEKRATWTVYHARAEAIRQLKPHVFATAAAREGVTEQVVAAALGRESVELGVTLAEPPALVQRASGESIYQRHGSTRYTSHAILEAETRLLEAAGQTGGPLVPLPVARTAIARCETRSGRTLNPGQRQLVEQFVTSGRMLEAGIGPPGAGNSTAMRAVRAAWESTGGRVFGLAPSAAAASVLGDELGVRADTLHRLVRAWEDGAEVTVRAGDMLLVDEAGMAGTRLLDQVRAIATEHGAVIRLLGDYRQLTAVEAGGALRLIHNERGGTELAEVHRFRDPAEADAVLKLRVGDPGCVDFYTTHQRLHGGTRAAVLDALYAAWRSDTQAGRTAIMISDSTDIVRELSGRAQTERRAAGLAEPSGIRLHDDTTAGAGDRVVTRRNNRRLAVFGGADHVKNGDLWDVEARHPDGALTVSHARHHGKLTLPAWYVAEHVELGYAATIHRAQGLTVDISHAYLSPVAAREAALVALSRGTAENHAYLDTETVLSTGEPEVLPGDLFYRHRERAPVAAAFATIARREGAELSATEQLRAALDEPHRLDTVIPSYTHALAVYRGPDAAAEAATWVRQALVPEHAAEVVADPAWPALADVLLRLRDNGADPVLLLARRFAQRRLADDPADPARSVAQVLHYRLIADLPASTAGDARPALLPEWVPTPPAASDSESPEQAELGTWLREQADAIAARVGDLGEHSVEHTPAWTRHLGPVPDDPIGRTSWIARAGHVASYRERFGIPDTDPELLAGGQHGEAAHARAWITNHLATPNAGPAHADEPQPDRMDLSAEATWQRMARWRADHDHARQTGVTRPHSHLSDDQLHATIQRHRHRAETARRAQETAEQRVAELGPQVAAGQGPHVQTVDARVTELTRLAELATEHERLAREYTAVRGEADVAAARAVGKDREAERLTRWQTVRHPGLRDRLAAEAGDLRMSAADAHATAEQLLGRMHELNEQAGDHDLRRAPFEARIATEHYDRDRHTAQTTDQRDLDQHHREADRHGRTAAKVGATLDELLAEQQVRADMPMAQKLLEARLRTEWATSGPELEAEHRQTQRHDGFEHNRAYDPLDTSPHMDHGQGHGLSP